MHEVEVEVCTKWQWHKPSGDEKIINFRNQWLKYEFEIIVKKISILTCYSTIRSKSWLREGNGTNKLSLVIRKPLFTRATCGSTSLGFGFVSVFLFFSCRDIAIIAQYFPIGFAQPSCTIDFFFKKTWLASKINFTYVVDR